MAMASLDVDMVAETERGWNVCMVTCSVSGADRIMILALV